MRSIMPFYLFMLLLAAGNNATSGVSAYQSHASIKQTAHDYLVQEVTQNSDGSVIKVQPPDHRLRLHKCSTPLQPFSPPSGVGMGRTSVGVRCDSPKPWTIYVSATVGMRLPVVIAARNLLRGETLVATDVKLQTKETNTLLRGYFESASAINGKILKRPVRRNQVITPSMLELKKTVKRGERITIVAGSGAIKVSMNGKALRAGNPGDLIPVMNLASKKRLQARVVLPGLVTIE